MQFNKVLFTWLLVFKLCCLPNALTARFHHKGSSASMRILPLNQRKFIAHGRSSAPGSIFDDRLPNVAANGDDESRGFMKKLMLFKSLFYQQKSEPNNNIIIITQPAVTDTATMTMPPTTTGTTGTTTTTAAASPTGNDNNNNKNNENNSSNRINNKIGSDSFTEDEEETDNSAINMPLLNYGTIKELQDSHTQNIVQQLIKQTQPNRKRSNKVKKFNSKNLINQRQKNRRLRKRNQIRRRLSAQQSQLNRINVENLLNNMNLTKRPNQHRKNNNNNNSNSVDDDESNNHNNNNNNNDNNASGILNLNTNMRLQNIMNAFRKQTPIMYNY